MALSGAWVPETEEERYLMEDVAMALQRAERNGVDRDRMAAYLAFQSSAILDPRTIEPADEDSESLAEAMEAKEDQSPSENSGADECPDCGSEIDDWQGEIGGGVVIQPCGCEITDEEWLNDL